MTNRSDISNELKLDLYKRKDKISDDKKTREAKKEAEKILKEKKKKLRMKLKGSPGPGMDFPTSNYRKGGKIMVGYKAGGKV